VYAVLSFLVVLFADLFVSFFADFFADFLSAIAYHLRAPNE